MSFGDSDIAERGVVPHHDFEVSLGFFQLPFEMADLVQSRSFRLSLRFHAASASGDLPTHTFGGKG